MDRRWLIALAAVVIVWIAIASRRSMTLDGHPRPTALQMYPRAPAMPAAAIEPVESLLVRYERFLADRGPAVLASLQPGLDDAAIDSLESRRAFKLPGDLRALYRWRNGTARESPLDAFPDHRFIPLDEAIAERDTLQVQVARATREQREAHQTYAGHRNSWLGIIMDSAGDGYFFDPLRSQQEGSFFFSFAEGGTYIFYPAFRNFLAAIVQGNESGVFRIGATGAETVDFNRAQALWNRYGARPPD